MNSNQQFRWLFGRKVHGWSLRGIVRSIPLSLGMLALIIAIGLRSRGETIDEYRSTLDALGLSWQMVSEGRIWHIFTGSIIQSSPGIERSMILLLICSLVPCELLIGSKRTLATFLLSDWGASICSVVVLRLLAAFDHNRAASLLTMPDAGSSAAAHGCLAAAAVMLPRRWAIAAYSLIMAVTILLFFEQELDASLAHLVAILVGGGLSLRWWRPPVYREMAADQSA